MNFDEIKELIEIVNLSELRNFELSLDGAVVKMSKNEVMETSTVTLSNIEGSSVQEKNITMEQVKEDVVVEKEVTGNVIKSPIVGTFYESGAPSAPRFVSVGDVVKKGDIVCIIEAMKVMNEVVSEFDGVVKAVLAESEALVEYGQPLFIVG